MNIKDDYGVDAVTSAAPKKTNTTTTQTSSSEDSLGGGLNAMDYMTGSTDAGKLIEKYYNNPRRIDPLNYYDNLEVPNRIYGSPCSLRIGDCQIEIPPELISVRTITETNSTVSVRQSNSTKTKSGYSRRQIEMSLFFNGMNQINGYAMKSPFSYPYYMDGLRALLAQFKSTPFLPVENALLNNIHNIYNVSLSSIVVSTVPGFPHCLQVEVLLQEFNAEPYIEVSNITMHDFIDWDLFRWYYQQPLRDDGSAKYPIYRVKTGNFNGAFNFKILDEAVITGDVISKAISDKSNYYDTGLNSSANLIMTDMTASYQNIIPSIQLSKQSTPTSQYLGGLDTIFSFTFETQDEDVVLAINELNKTLQDMARDYKKYNGLGFLMVENELVQLMGVEYLMLNSMHIVTVPEFPGLYRIQVEAISYDVTQYEKEALEGFKPFPEATGTESHLISNKMTGLHQKIKQDLYVEQKLREMNLYPDLHLPSYSQLNTVVGSIRTFRSSNKLSQLPYSTYPKNANDDAIYVDPDFYMFYPVAHQTSISEVARDINNKHISTATNQGTYNNPATSGDFFSLVPSTNYKGRRNVEMIRTDRWNDLISKVARDTSTDPRILKSIMNQESGGNPSVVSSAGALGLTQIMPTTGKFVGFGDTNRLRNDPEYNIRAAAATINQKKKEIAGRKQDVTWRNILRAYYGLDKPYADYADPVLLMYKNLCALQGITPSKTPGFMQMGEGVGGANHTTRIGEGNSGDLINMDYNTFGEPIRAFSPIEMAGQDSVFTSADDKVERMCTDMVKYNKRGRLLRAFPTYCILILDDGGEWMDGQKLWSNYYPNRSLVDVKIHQDRTQPAHTAMITITNMYSNLNRTPRLNDWRDRRDENGMYRLFGGHWGTPKVTEKMIENKNRLFETIKMEPGARIHIRLGYGNNAKDFNVNFNGIITEMNAQDMISLVAQSDGVELTNNVIGASKPDEVNSMFNLGNEPSNIIGHILERRESRLLFFVNNKWGEKNKFGIEHFGMKIHGSISNPNHPVDMLNIDTNKLNEKHNISYWGGGVKLNIAQTIHNNSLNGIDTGVEDPELSGKKQALNKWSREYDLVKNIYLARNDRPVPMSNKELTVLNFDKEGNIKMFLYNKTPWDVFQVTAQSMPEFICQPHYHQFDSRVFFGHPSWNHKYRYELQNGRIREEAKPFSQVHVYTSYNDIIDNQIKATSADLYTNCVASYTVSNNLHTTPAIYADKNIDWSQQRTKVVDTTVMQDLVGPDAVYGAVFGWKPGKDQAIRVAISNLIDTFQKMYDGTLMVLGDPSVKPCDTIMVHDDYADMYGIAEVREVIHSLGIETGFVTEIVPDLMTSHADSAMSKISNVGKLYSFLMGYSGAMYVRYLGIKTMSLAGRAIVIGSGFQAVSAMKVYASTLKTVVSGGQILKDFKGSMAAMRVAYEGVRGANGARGTIVASYQTAKGIKAGLVAKGTIIAPGVGTIVMWVVSTVLLNTILEKFIDFLSYNNVLKIYPLIHNNRPYVAGIRGHKKLIPGYQDSMSDSDYTREPSMYLNIEDATFDIPGYGSVTYQDLMQYGEYIDQGRAIPTKPDYGMHDADPSSPW